MGRMENKDELKVINKNERLKYRQIINQLKQQLEDKDKEIQELKLKLEQAEEIINNPTTLIAQQSELINSLNKQIELLKYLGNHETTIDLFKDNSKLIIEKRQLAIQELEKVKDIVVDNLKIYGAKGKKIIGDELISSEELIDEINKQIKELKGE